MRITRTGAAAALLLVEAGIAALGVLVHYGWSAEYGDIADSALEGLWSGLTAGTSGLALVLVAVAAAVAVAAMVSSRLWIRLTAVGIPVLMMVAMLAVTPAALREKLESQYDATPQCVSDVDSGPGLDAERESQRAFDSIDHVGHFRGGGGSGVDGCDRSFALTEDVDVLEHYRVALDEAGWRVVEDDAHHLRAERDGMAFEVVTCAQGGVVWAGRDDAKGGAPCDQE